MAQSAVQFIGTKRLGSLANIFLNPLRQTVESHGGGSILCFHRLEVHRYSDGSRGAYLELFCRGFIPRGYDLNLELAVRHVVELQKASSGRALIIKLTG